MSFFLCVFILTQIVAHAEAFLCFGAARSLAFRNNAAQPQPERMTEKKGQCKKRNYCHR